MPNDSEERFARIEANLEKFSQVVNTLAAAMIARDDQIEAHDRQIGALIKAASKHEKAIANLERQWQAYLRTIHPKQ